MTNFFENFVRQIQTESDLIDVAPIGVAQQSSMSKWSRENDAQRAVSRIGKADFAFHTDQEKQAWWRLDFDQIYYPEALCIENRETEAFWEISARIRVKVSVGGDSWTTVHDGMVFYGSFNNGIPLVLPLAQKIPVRHILIENSQPGYFHLKSVRVLAPVFKSYGQTTPVFMANRKDGFGERLKAIVNSIALARHFKGEFQFSWEPLSKSMAVAHAIFPPEQTFSEEFSSKYLSRIVPNIDLREYFQNLRNADSAQIPTPAIVSVPQIKLEKVDHALKNGISPDMLSDAFWEIGFSDPLKHAIELALNVDLQNQTTGLHLRAGDIVFGRFRFHARYLDKVVPYPIAVQFIQEQKERGKSVILFGQDELLCQYLARKYDAIFAADYHHEHDLSVLQAALFDIVLMSRCQVVVAGNSGFSHIAQIIGQFKTLDPGEIYPPQKSTAIIKDMLLSGEHASSVSDLQKAFAASYAFNILKSVVSKKTGSC